MTPTSKVPVTYRRDSISAGAIALFLVGLSLVVGCGRQSAGTPLERAKAEFGSGHWDESIAACDEAIAQNANDAAAYVQRGRAQSCAGRPQQAVGDFTVAIRLNPQDSEAYYQRADAYRDLGKTAEKEADDLMARRLDASYNDLVKRDGTLTLDPEATQIGPEGLGADKEAKKPSADDAYALPKPPGTEEETKRNIVEEMLGIPLDLPETPRAPKVSSHASLHETPARPATPAAPPSSPASRGLITPDLGLGRATPPNTRVNPAAAGGVPGAAVVTPPDRPAAAAPLGQAAAPARGVAAGPAGAGARPSASPLPYPAEYRNMHPYGPSAMRSTGTQEAAPIFDPYGGYQQNMRGRAATVGGPPYSPPGRQPYAGPRTAYPNGPRTDAPPGNRYDGGRGYGF